MRSRYVEAPPIDVPPAEEFLPPPPDEVVKNVGGTFATFLDGFADFLEAPAKMVRKMANDVRSKRV